MAKGAFSSLPCIADALLDADDICICGHVNPDGDCIGSVLALTHALKGLGKRVSPLIERPDMLDDSLHTLPGVSDLVRSAEVCSCTYFITVDVSALDRIDEAARGLFERAAHTITIDHHEVAHPLSERTYCDPLAPSTTCLIWELCAYLSAERTQDIAHCTYAGLMTDTGRFQYSNTTPVAFRLAEQMVSAGADVARISCDFFQNRTYQSVLLEKIALEHLELIGDADIALSWVSNKDMSDVGAVSADCEGLIDVLRSLGQVRIACMLKEQGSIVRGSLRSKDGSDVAALARTFGGGGHKAAAGFTLTCPLDEALRRVKQALLAD